MNLNCARPALRSIAVSLVAASCALPALSAPGADTSAAVGIHAGATARQSTAAGHDSTARVVRPAKKKALPIDVRALASAQTTMGPEIPAPAPVRSGDRKSGLPAFVAALAVAGISTMLILFTIARRSKRRTAEPVPAPMAVPAAPVSDVEESVPLPVDPDDDEEPSFGVGGDLRNARGEFDLAMRLHSGSMGDGSRRSARTACAPDATTAQRVKVAKRLGIGRGEIDLALRLQKLESVPAEEETT